MLSWNCYWTHQTYTKLLNRVMDALALALQMDTYPLITLLQIFATIPVIAATYERSFSALKLLKTFFVPVRQ